MTRVHNRGGGAGVNQQALGALSARLGSPPPEYPADQEALGRAEDIRACGTQGTSKVDARLVKVATVGLTPIFSFTLPTSPKWDPQKTSVIIANMSQKHILPASPVYTHTWTHTTHTHTHTHTTEADGNCNTLSTSAWAWPGWPHVPNYNTIHFFKS